MYLSKIVNDNLDRNKNKFQGFVSYKALVRRLNSTFKDLGDLRFKTITYNDIDVNNFLVGGLYDQMRNQKYVIFNLSSYTDELFIEDYMWKDFKFAILQTILHETIHQNQYQHRPYVENGIKLDFKVIKGSIDEDREYLSDLDEIDAYAHDIAMEIKYHYSHLDPYYVLKTISYKRKLSSYKYYTKTFRGCDWGNIKKRLLSKTYKWIQYV